MQKMNKKKEYKFTQKQEEKFEEFILSHLWWIQSAGDMTHFRMSTLSVHDEPKHRGGDIIMEIEPRYDYLDFTLGYGRKKCAQYWINKNHRTLIQTLCHEVAHIITGEASDMLEYKSKTKDIEFYFERVTEHTSRWLYHVYQDYMTEHSIDLKTGKIKTKK